MLKIEHDVDMTRRNTFGMKVRSSTVVEYDSVADLEEIRRRPDLYAPPVPVLHIGSCSNLLFTKDFYPGILLHSNIRFIRILPSTDTVSPPAGKNRVESAGKALLSRAGEIPLNSTKDVPLNSDGEIPLHCVEDVPFSSHGKVYLSHAEEIFHDSAGETPLHSTEDVPLHSAGEAGKESVIVEVGAGTAFDEFCAWAAEQGLWGVENLSGIPGEVGAAAVQNIGAYGMEVKDAILKVNCYDMNLGRQVSFAAADCGYGYRTSLFKTHRKGRYIVTSVTFRLSAAPRPVLGYGHLRSAVESALSAKTAAIETALSPETDAAATKEASIQTAEAVKLSTTVSKDGIMDRGIGSAAETPERRNPETSLTPQLIRDVVLQTRAAKLPDPAQVGSAGSFFKNPVVPRSDYDRVENIARFEQGPDYKVPCFDAGSGFVKIPAAWLIEHCGWKGRTMGNAGVYAGQPLVIVNATGRAAAAEILALEAAITASVRDKYGILLTPEVEHV